MITRTELDVGNIDFELQAKRDDKFSSFTSLLTYKKLTYRCSQMATWDGVLDENVTFQMDKWLILKNLNWILSTCDPFLLIMPPFTGCQSKSKLAISDSFSLLMLHFCLDLCCSAIFCAYQFSKYTRIPFILMILYLFLWNQFQVSLLVFLKLIWKQKPEITLKYIKT